jgi:hypothetical protein
MTMRSYGEREERSRNGIHVKVVTIYLPRRESQHSQLQEPHRYNRRHSLGRRVLDKLNTLANVTSQTLITLCQKLLLVVIGRRNDIDGLLGAFGAELDGDREEITTSFLLDGFTAVDAGQVDECGFGDGGLALDGLEQLLGEAEAGVGHREGCGAGAVLGLDDFVTAELDACEGRQVRRLL